MRLTSFVAFRTTALTAGLACALACGSDTTGPRPISGRFALTTFGDSALPVIVVTSVSVPPRGGGPTVRCNGALVSETLTFDAATVTESDSVVRTCDDGAAPTSSVDTLVGTYHASGDAIVISFPGFPYETRLYARRVGAGIVVTRTELRDASSLVSTDERRLVFAALP